MENLATYLKTRDISQREFAQDLGVHPSIISRLKSGMSPSLELAVKIERLTKGRVKAVSWVPDIAQCARCGVKNQGAQE